MKKNKPGIFGALLIVLLFGCASHPAANVKESGPKRITDIQLIKSSESLIFTIKANQSLTYTANKLDFPIGVLLYFSETGLGLDRSIYTPPDNEIISSIKAQEIVKDKTTNVRIFFALKKESSYNLTNDDAGIKITFPRTTALSDTKPQKKYSALPTDTGLLIHVGKIPASSNQAGQTESDDSSGTGRTGQVKLVWNEVPDATSYNVYWSKFPGVSRQNGNRISEIKNPTTTIKGLRPGDRYYFVVTAVKGTAESKESEELSFTVKK
jgi:hypothetical protein